MGYLQGSGQDSNIRWKTVLNQDEGGSRSPALNRPHASKLADSGLSVRRQSVYPSSNLLSTTGSDSLPVHRKVLSDVPTTPGFAEPFCHLRPSMGRLSLHNYGATVGKTPLGILHKSTTAQHVDRDGGNFDLRSDTATGSVWLPEKDAPLSIRNHIKAQLKATDQDRNGMRIRHSNGLRSDDTLSAPNRRTTRREYSNHCLPVIPMELENKEKIPKNGNITTSLRHRKQTHLVGGPTRTATYGMSSSHGYGSPIGV